MAQVIHTYFEPVFPFAADVLGKFKLSWEKHGWEVMVHTKEMAMAHPAYDSFMAAAEKLPTVNGAAYELCCYRRWLAFALIDEPTPLISDYDILNINLPPPLSYTVPTQYFSLALLHFPTVLFQEFLGFMQKLFPVLPPPSAKHVSDMLLFHLFAALCQFKHDGSLVSEFPDSSRPLVHFLGYNKKKELLNFPL